MSSPEYFHMSKSVPSVPQIVIVFEDGFFVCFGFFFSFLVELCSVEDLSSPNRDRSHTQCSGSSESQSLGHQRSHEMESL